MPSLRVRLWSLGAAGLLSACGLPTRQDVQQAEFVESMGQAVQELQASQQDLYERVDSLAAIVARQDSLLRNLANLLGAPLPPR